MTADLLALLDAHTEAWRRWRISVSAPARWVGARDLTAAEHHAQDTYNALAAAIVAASQPVEGVHP